MSLRKTISSSIILLAFALVILCSGSAQAQDPIDLIQWNEPKPAVERLAGDEWVPPKGWKEATEGVDEIFIFNSGAMRHDPATAENIEIFEEKTGIQVNYAEVSSEILFQKTLSTLVSKDPSVTAMSLDSGPYELRQVVGAGWAEPMPFWTEGVKEAYPSSMLPALTGDDGKVYATVDTMRAYQLFYRPSWLEAAGVEEVPTTWQGIKEAAEKCADWANEELGSDYYGIVFPAKSYNLMHMLQSGIYSQGARVMEEGEPVYNTPEGRNSWDYWVDMVKSGAAPEAVLGWTWNDYQEVFARGKSAFMLGFTTYVNRLADSELSPAVQKNVHGEKVEGPKGVGDWAAMAPPKWDKSMPDKYRASFIDFDAWIINKYAPPAEKAAALLLAELRMSKQGMANEVVKEGNESFYPGTYKDDEVKENILYADSRAKAVDNTVMETFPPGAMQANDILIEYFARSVQGELAPEEALKQAQDEIDAIYE